MSPFRIRDTITGRTVTCERHDVADALAPWFVAAPEDVARGVADLQAAVLRREPTDGLLALLGLVVEDGAR